MHRVAIIFDNFGPYHIARLRAASAVCELMAIEVAGQSATYAWDKVTATATFQRTTLIEKGTSGGVSRAELLSRLDKSLDLFQPAAVVVPGWASPAAWGAMRWCLQHRVPMVCMSESTAWDEPRAGWKEWIKRQLLGLFASALVGGERHRDYLTALGFPAARVFLGYDVVDNAYFGEKSEAAVSSAESVRVQYNLPRDYFLASARFIEKKNLPRLLEAYAQYRASCQMAEPWSLVLLGDGSLREELEQKREELGLLDSVLMPGFKQIEDLPAYYGLAGAFIHPSTIEPWGLVVNEALACGLPVLVSDRCGCVPELVIDGVNGFRFDPYDVADISRRMKEVSAPDFPRAELRKSSLALIARWGPERFGRGVTEAVAAALAQREARSTLVQRALLALLLRR